MSQRIQGAEAQVLRGAASSGAARALPSRQPQPPLAAAPVPPQPQEKLIQCTEAQWDARCAQIRAETEQELREQLFAEAQVRAREAARQEQQAWQERQQQQQAQQWRALAQTLAEQFRGLREELGTQVLELTQLAAARWLGQQWADPAQLRPLVQAVLQQFGHDKPLRVALHPQDWQRWVAQQQDAAPADELSVQADERVALGGCLIESARQTIDARLETQLALLHEVFAEARQAGAAAAEEARGA